MVFSDDYYNYNEDLDFARKIINTAQNRTESIPDHGHTLKVNDTTLATFDFHVLKSGKTFQQNFWVYKITLSSYPAPEITAPTKNQTIDVAIGSEAELSVTAKNAENYKWQVDKGDGNGFEDIDGAVNANYTTPVTTANNQNYKYRCVVINTAGNDISPVFSIDMIETPAFTNPDENKEIELDEGQSIDLTVTVLDAESYQWQIDTGNGFKDIEGATSATYTVPTVAEENLGDKYRCIASNLVGSTTSFEFVLKVNNIDSPVITKGNEDAKTDVEKGEKVILSVKAKDGETYQWQVDDGNGFKNIEDAIKPDYTVNTDKDGQFKYRCIVSNENGETASGTFTVNVSTPVSIPETNDFSNIGLIVFVMLLSFIAFAITLRRKRT